MTERKPSAHLVACHNHIDGAPEGGPIYVDSPRGIEIGFTSDRFETHSYLWEMSDAIYVSAIQTREHGRGDFRALVERILALPKVVKVPEPLLNMRGILERAGYRRTIEFDEPTGYAVNVYVMEPKERR